MSLRISEHIGIYCVQQWSRMPTVPVQSSGQYSVGIRALPGRPEKSSQLRYSCSTNQKAPDNRTSGASKTIGRNTSGASKTNVGTLWVFLEERVASLTQSVFVKFFVAFLWNQRLREPVFMISDCDMVIEPPCDGFDSGRSSPSSTISPRFVSSGVSQNNMQLDFDEPQTCTMLEPPRPQFREGSFSKQMAELRLKKDLCEVNSNCAYFQSAYFYSCPFIIALIY